ncbi:MAG: glycosyltransferase family 4 protein [Thermomicrobiales bacterium]|nr:glycosyltransferase family 4 protein [Thermomicrobiales bacterium]
MTHRNPESPSNRITIAFDASFLALPASGIGTYVRNLSAALIARQDALGLEMRLVEPKPGRIFQPGHKVHRFLWDAVGATPAMLRQVGRPDVLHLPQMSAPIWSPSPMVVTIHDVIPLVLDDYRASRAMRTYLSLMVRTSKRARYVIAPSEAARADIARIVGIDAERIVAIPEAADPALVPDPTGQARQIVAQRWGVTGPYLFNIGGFDRRKNLPLTIEAFAAALPQLPDDAKLVIGGAPHSGNEMIFPPLAPVIRQFGLDDRVVLTGRVSDEDRTALYQAATGYITASSYEGFGLTPLEAMACGVPAIVANRTSLPEVVGDAGLIVEPSVDDLASAMVSLLTESERHIDLARRSLERASQFTWDTAAERTAAVYHRASRT